MKFLIFVSPKDFKDETLSSVKLFLERWDLDYKISSYTSGSAHGLHGDIADIDVNTNIVTTSDYDGIILIDGQGIDEYKLYEFRPLLDIITLFNEAKKIIIAFGNSTSIIARANIITDKKISTLESDPNTVRFVKLFHGIISSKDIEISDNIITVKDSNKTDELFDKILENLNIE